MLTRKQMKDRITELEALVAELQARIDELEGGPLYPAKTVYPSKTTYPEGTK